MGADGMWEYAFYALVLLAPESAAETNRTTTRSHRNSQIAERRGMIGIS